MKFEEHKSIPDGNNFYALNVKEKVINVSEASYPWLVSHQTLFL